MNGNRSRITMSLRNAKTSLVFYFLILVLNLFSRKIFLQHFGDSLSGLITTIQNTVGLLNLADIGIATAITWALFKPLYEDDKKKVGEIISVFCFLFRIIGIGLITVGIILMFVLPLFLSSQEPTQDIIICFGVFLVSSSLTYFVNYKQQILVAVQRSYIITAIQNSTVLLKIAIQLLVVIYLQDNLIFYSWLFVELLFAVIYSIIINNKVHKDYPWLKPSYSEGKAVRHKYSYVHAKLKNIVSHKFANVILLQTDSLIIGFVSLVNVTFYYNYALIISKLTQLVSSLVSGGWAGVGNLVSEGEEKKISLVFFQYNAMLLAAAGILSLCFLVLANSFIDIWLGNSYILDNNVFFVMVLSLYISIIRMPVSIFLNGFGLYEDSWSSWFEAALNLVISIIGSYYYGLIGVVVGTAISTTLVGLFWKPYFLFSKGLKVSVICYYRQFIHYLLLLIIVSVLAIIIVPPIMSQYVHHLWQWFIAALIVLIVISIIYVGLLSIFSRSIRTVILRFLKLSK